MGGVSAMVLTHRDDGGSPEVGQALGARVGFIMLTDGPEAISAQRLWR